MISMKEVEAKLGLTYVGHIRKRKDIKAIKTDQGMMITKDDFKILQEEESFKEKSITLSQAEEISGVSKAKIRHRLKDGEWRVVRNVFYVNKEAFERLEKELEPVKEFLENSVTLSQAAQISGLSGVTIRKHLKEEEEWINFDGGVYVNKQALERLMNNRGITPITPEKREATEVPDGYILFKEVCDKNNFNHGSMRDRIRRDLKEHTIKVGKLWYLNETIIPTLIEERDWIQNSYTRKDLEKMLDLTEPRLLIVLDQIKKDVEWRLIGKFDYFNKNMIDNKIAECGGANQYYESCRNLRSSGYDESFKQVTDDVVEINDETFINVNTVEKIYNLTAGAGATLTPKVLMRMIKNGVITDFFRGANNSVYVSKKELDTIENTLNQSISMVELGEEWQKITGAKANNKKTILRLLPDDAEVFRFNVFGVPHDRIRTANPKQFKADFIKRVKDNWEYRNIKNPHDRYEYLEKKEFTKEQNKQFAFTIKTYKAFVFNKFNNTKSNDLTNLAHEVFNSLSRFINITTKDIHLLSDNEILQILSSDELTGVDRNHLSNYLNYLRRKYPEECVFQNRYNRYTERRVRAVDDVYTLEEWHRYSNFLTDINRHIEKSFERYSYAKRWLYAILHFSVAWRSGDFLETPGLDFLDNSGNSELDNLDIDRYTLDWFKNNDFKLSDGQIIINSVKRFVEDRETRKTGARKHFVIPCHYVIPVSIAFIIAEKHRRASNSTTLFSIGKIEPKSLCDFLGEEMAGFSSKKANRSLLSYIYDEANESQEYNSIAYSMASYMRSHKPNMYQKAEITSQYIYALNKDGDIHTISRQLFRRGVFGWLYKVMLDLAYGNGSAYGEQYSSLSQMTTDIETLQKELSVNGIENMSRFMTYELDIRRNVFNELFKAPKDQLKELIHQLILGNLSSKERDIYCITPKKCPFPTQNSCKGCRYSIPTNYSLLAISDELLALCEKLSLVDIDDTVSRQKYSFQITRLMMVLREAKTEFDRFDPDYFKTFVPLKKLGNRIEEVKPKML